MSGGNGGDLRILIALFGLALAARLTIALTVPAWQGPDEPKHFEYIRVLVDDRSILLAERRLPRLDDASPAFEGRVIVSMAANNYWRYVGLPRPAVLPQTFFDVWRGKSSQLHRPSLYYFLGAVTVAPFQNASLTAQLLVARVLSALLSALTVLVTFWAARELVPDDAFVPIVSAAFVAMLPMHVFMGGVVNNDNLLTLSGGACALALVRAFRTGFGVRGSLAVAGAVVVALLTKRAAVALLAGVGVAVVAWLVRLRGWRLMIVVAGSVVACGILLAVWTWLGPQRVLASLSAYALNEPDQIVRLEHGSETYDLGELLGWQLTWFFKSFWGVFGWFAIPLSQELYLALTVVSGACAVGFGMWLINQVAPLVTQHRLRHATRLTTSLAFVAIVLSVALLAIAQPLSYFSPADVPQGRYLFVAITPLAICGTLGLRTWWQTRLFGTRIPILLTVASLAALMVVAYTGYCMPFFATTSS